MGSNEQKTLGGYELIERIATGGMASLYLARRAGARGFVRPVAIKVVHPHLTDDPEFVSMFVHEANLCSRLSHPNIVHVEELGEENDCLYIAMEFVDGCSLGALLTYTHAKNTPLALPVGAYIIASAADGLYAAHEARGDRGERLNIVHRDVSPSNLLLSRTGHVKLIDFGVAKSTDKEHQTQSRKLKGKMAYMSPEQLLCEPIDQRSDIYSLGVLLWEVLANQPAFRSKNEVSILQEVVRKPRFPIDSVRQGLPEKLVAAVTKATQRHASARFFSALDFREALLDAVPEMLQVTQSEISALVEQVLAVQGPEPTPMQRVRSGTSSLPQAPPAPTRSSWTITSRLPPASPASPTPPASPVETLPSPDIRPVVIIAAAALVAVAAIVALVVVGPWSPAPMSDPLTEARFVPAPEPMKPQLPLERNKASPKEKAWKGGEASLGGAKKKAKPPKRAKPRRNRSRRRPASHRLAIDTERPQTQIDPVRPVRVDGVILAGPDFLDQSTMRPVKKAATAVEVDEDNVKLADDYQ